MGNHIPYIRAHAYIFLIIFGAYCHVYYWLDGFKLVNRFIHHLQVVTTNNCNSTAGFHITNHFTLFSQSTLTGLYLVKTLSNGCSSAVFPIKVPGNESSAFIAPWLTHTTVLRSLSELNRFGRVVASERTHRELFYRWVTSPRTCLLNRPIEMAVRITSRTMTNTPQHIFKSINKRRVYLFWR
jgi:hypothetical protein